MKKYVVEEYYRNSDGDLLVRIEVFESIPEEFSYLVFTK